MLLITFSKEGKENIVLTENDLFDFSYEDACFSGDTFELGGAIARKLRVVIDNNTGRFSRGTFANCRVKLEINEKFYGWYNTELPKRRNGVIELTAYDDMVKLDTEYPSDYLFPQTFWAVYAQCVYTAGLASDISFDNVVLNGVLDNGVISASYTQYIYANSCRKLVAGMAEWNGGYAHINADNKLQIDKFSKTISREYSSGNLLELDYSDETVTFTKIKTSQKNKTYEKGSDDGYTLTINNQYISYGLDDANFELYLTKIFEYYSGFTLTPMSFTLAEPDLDLRVGDRVKVFDEEEQIAIYGNVSKIELSGNLSMVVTCGGFDSAGSSNGFTPTSYSQIQQSKQEAKAELSAGTVLTDYKYISDLSAQCNGITYTAEKDTATGLISKIADSAGHVLTPEIPEGITDIAMHNAAIFALAMARGLGAPDPAEEIIKSAIYRLYEPDGTVYTPDITGSDITDNKPDEIRYTDKFVDTGIPQSRLTGSTSGVTLAFVLKPTAWAAYYGLLGLHVDSDGINIQAWGATDCRALLYRHYFAFPLIAGEKHVLIVADSETEWYAMHNTTVKASGNDTPTNQVSPMGNITLYNSYEKMGSRNYHGIAYDALIWDRALTQDEALAVAKRLMAQHNIGGNT